MNMNISTERGQNFMAEASVLAAALIEEVCAARVCAELTGESFADPKHARIFDAVQKLRKEGSPIDPVTVSAALDGGGIDMEYLARLMEQTPTTAHLPAHIDLVRTAHREREAARGIAAQQTALADGGVAAFSQAWQTTGERVNGLGAADVPPIKEYLMDAVQAMGDRTQFGLATGFGDLDAVTHGMRGGELLVLGARPSVGKTALAGNIAVNVAKRGGGVAFFSLEMGREQLAQRFAMSEARVSRQDVMQGNTEDAARLMEAAERVARLPLYIEDGGAQDMAHIRATCYRLHARRGLALIVVDYIGLIDTPQRKNGTREREVAELSREFKRLARELNVPVLLLSQLNRGMMNRSDPRPMLSDLRESGALEQDADVVLLLHRATASDGAEDEHIARLSVAKNRNGAVKEIGLYFRGAWFRFEGMAQQSARPA